jgi:hypothetical protein
MVNKEAPAKSTDAHYATRMWQFQALTTADDKLLMSSKLEPSALASE